MTPAPDAACSTCRFYDEVRYRDRGLCRRNAPRSKVSWDPNDEDGRPWTAWPLVSFYDWCGEWFPASPDSAGPGAVLTAMQVPERQP